MWGLSRLIGILDFCAVYFTTQLVRCAAFSFVLAGLVMLLRKIIPGKRIFLRGLLWTAFLLVPFLGRLKMFYEDTAVGRMTFWITEGTMTCLWADRIYMAGILVMAVWLFGKRLYLLRMVGGMEKIVFENTRIYIAQMNVTPFTAGLWKPKIVLPQVMLDSYSGSELRMVVRHEQIHIRLGHLWYGFVWDILRCLFWVNPFLSICQKHFRADMEDICDRVCIQNGGITPREYGLVLLKSLKLLHSGQANIPFAAAYAGERGFAEMKRRISQIADFRPYRKKLCLCMAGIVFMATGFAFLVIHTHSYACYSEDNDILVYEYDGGIAGIWSDTDSLSRMISYDESYVYVDSGAFEDFLRRNHAEGEIYIVFGGYSKLPGLGGAAEACFYERHPADGGTVRIPYESIRNQWDYMLFKLL